MPEIIFVSDILPGNDLLGRETTGQSWNIGTFELILQDLSAIGFWIQSFPYREPARRNE